MPVMLRRSELVIHLTDKIAPRYEVGADIIQNQASPLLGIWQHWEVYMFFRCDE